ncbi:hypothetical protein [Myxococcus landrumensis]|uniref:Uncharacterized protein n=1 Tax=Myxococcus landrumensis TaxID=2813577 RepID=A0ABX7NFZ3_9BACT|nr:hypothetical protein [Myxococcus landrumus]QSQ17323.1 hypothetical protein JY572_15225 [Myxococcus landrumus]
MRTTFESIQEILKAGANVHLHDRYPPGDVERLATMAREHGGHLLVSGDYTSDWIVRWAKAGGSHFTFVVQSSVRGGM